MIFVFATESLYSIERAFKEMVTGEYKSRPQTLHATTHQKIMAWYGGDETILQIICCAVKSSMNSGHFIFLHAAHAYTFQGPPVTTVGDLAKATTMTSLNLLHMRSDTTFFRDPPPFGGAFKNCRSDDQQLSSGTADVCFLHCKGL